MWSLFEFSAAIVLSMIEYMASEKQSSQQLAPYKKNLRISVHCSCNHNFDHVVMRES
jgi:hypothetical protein